MDMQEGLALVICVIVFTLLSNDLAQWRDESLLSEHSCLVDVGKGHQ
jgi:hypothetical protein